MSSDATLMNWPFLWICAPRNAQIFSHIKKFHEIMPHHSTHLWISNITKTKIQPTNYKGIEEAKKSINEGFCDMDSITNLQEIRYFNT